VEALHRVAARLHARAVERFGAPAARLPPLLFVTDPRRTPDPVAVARRLPPGSGVVFRAFGAADAVDIGRRLAAVARDRRLTLLVGADVGLARTVRAGGVHLPERLLHRAPAIRAAWPDAVLTSAAHSRAAVARAARMGVDAVLLSAVFASESPSAGAPLGVLRFSALVRAAALPVYALGGVDERRAALLARSGAVGLAAVSAFS
jgi:thiamine-phosphate pyrophosphorylase